METMEFKEMVLEPILQSDYDVAEGTETREGRRYLKPLGYNSTIESYNPDISLLTPLELEMWRVINSHRRGGGLLFWTSSPGFAKSAIYANIARKLGLNFITVSLGGADETEIGNYPSKRDIETIDMYGEKVTFEVIGHIPPEWAARANERPTLIHFEEINRCPKQIRNAILQMINERIISHILKFNHNVYMCSSGNLDDEDTEEMGKALRGRVVHIHREITIEEWYENFAKYYVHDIVIEYIFARRDQFNPTLGENHDSITHPSARSWTFFSFWLTENLTNLCLSNSGEGKITHDMVDILSKNVYRFVGKTGGNEFTLWLRDNIGFSIYDIIENYTNLRDSARKKLNRTTAQGYMETLKRDKDFYIGNLNETQWENFKSFLLETLPSTNGKETPLFGQDQLTEYARYFFFDINNDRVSKDSLRKLKEEKPWLFKDFVKNFKESLGVWNVTGESK